MRQNEKINGRFLWSRYGIYLLIFVVLVLLIIAFSPIGSKSAHQSEEIVFKNSAELYSDPDTGDGKTFKRNEDRSIYNLIDNYYQALMADDDVQLMRYVDDVTRISAAQRILYSVYAERMNSLDTYVIAGLVSHSYVVVGIGYVKIKNVETPVPLMEKFFVLTNESGNIYITTKELNENMASYNELMYENGTIKNLIYQVALEYDQVLDKEPLLQEIFRTLPAERETNQEN